VTTTPDTALAVEQIGIEVIPESQRRGRPADLFWPWAAANVSVLGISFAAFILFFGVSVGQAAVAGLIGITFSFFLTGLVSLAGKRGSAPTMVLSRAPFGVRGNVGPSLVSYLLLVGWEIVLVSLAVLATATVFGRLGWASGDATRVVAFVVVAGLVILAGVMGFDLIMQVQRWITLLTLVLTVGYILLTASAIDLDAVSAIPPGSAAAFVAALVFAMTGFGLGWVNCGADYSRYLPRGASGPGIVWWTTFGASLAPLVLVGYGLLLAGSDEALRDGVANDPIGALTGLLPVWYLVPFIVVVVAGLVGGAVLDIYSSGLALLTLGVRVPRWMAAGFDGVLMVLGTIYFVWVADSFFLPFQGFLYTLGVPIAAWVGVFVADMQLRRRPYHDESLFDPDGRYGAVSPPAVGLFVLGALLGWGLVDNSWTTGLLAWQGYLFDVLPFPDDSAWRGSNLGVLVAIVVGYGGYLLLGRGRVRRQEAAELAG
jgi:purine-cytosine permease-like protein